MRLSVRPNSGFQISRPLDYVYDREWTVPPDVFAQDASKAVRALSSIAVRPDFKTMFSNNARHSVSIIPDRAAPFGMRAYRSLQWMKRSSHNRHIDVKGRDSHMFRVRSSPRAVTDMQEAEALISSAVRLNWRILQSPPALLRQRAGKDPRKKIVITDSSPVVTARHNEEQRHISGLGEDEDDSSTHSSLSRDWPSAAFSQRGTINSENRFRIRGLSPSEETLILINRQELHLVREAWEATLPAVDTTLADCERRAALVFELEKDKWTLRSKEIDALNRARYLSCERDRNKRRALLNDIHSNWLEQGTQASIKQLKSRVQSLRQTQARAMRKLQNERDCVEKRRPKKDPIRFLVDPSYDGFAPQTRLGDHARRWHEYLPNRGKLFEDAKAVKQLEKCISEDWTPSNYELAAAKEKKPPELCVYLTKWTPAKLKTLHADLKEIRKVANRNRCRFKPRELEQHSDVIEQDDISNHKPRFVSPQEVKMLQAVLTLQKILRGRAVQAMMYKGRRHNRELIREILSSKPFDTGEEDSTLATQGLNASTGWPRLKTYDEYCQRPLQEKWVQRVLSDLPPTLDVYNLMDFVNMNLMKMRHSHEKSSENTETVPTPAPLSDKTSKTSLDGTFISCSLARPGKKRPATPKRRPLCEGVNLSEELEVGRVTARVRQRQPRQGLPIAVPQEQTAESPSAPVPMSQDMVTHVGRVDRHIVHEIPTILQPVTIPTSANVSAVIAARPSSADSSVQELRGTLSQRSTVEIHGRSISHVGFRSGPWIPRSPPTDCPGTPASEDTVTAISRFTGEDFLDRRLEEEEEDFPGQPPSGQRFSVGFNVSTTASEDTPSTDDTHIITDDATELFAAAFRAKVREQGNTLAAQRIDEAPSPADSVLSSTLALPVLGRSVSQQRAHPDLTSSVSEDQERRVITQPTTSETTITTDTGTSESSWTLNEIRQMGINRYFRDKNRTRVLQKGNGTQGPRPTGGEKEEPTIEFNEKDD